MAKQDSINELMKCVVNTPEELQSYITRFNKIESPIVEKLIELRKEPGKYQTFREDSYDKISDMLFPLPSRSNWFAFFCASSNLFFLLEDEQKRDLLFNVLANFKEKFEPSLVGTQFGIDQLLSKKSSENGKVIFDHKKKLIDSMKLKDTLHSRWNTFKQRLLENFPGLFAFLHLEMPVTKELTDVVESALFVGLPLDLEPENQTSDSFLNQSVSGIPDTDSFLNKDVSGIDFSEASQTSQAEAASFTEGSQGSPLFGLEDVLPPEDLGPGKFLPPDETTSEEEPILAPKGRKTPEESFVEDFVAQEDELKENEDEFLNQNISIGM
jgi:hypothetical protein